MDNRIGKFIISKHFIEDDLESMHMLLAELKFVPLRVRHRGYPDDYEYIGYSPQFEEVKEEVKLFGVAHIPLDLPEYDMIFSGHATGTVTIECVRIRKN